MGNDSVKKHEISLLVENEDNLLDSSSDHLVIAVATMIGSKNGKHVTFHCPEEYTGVTDKSVDTEETVDIDTTLETTTTLETNIDTTLENVDTLETGHALANMDEFAEDDEDCEMPLSQNIHRERYLRCF